MDIRQLPKDLELEQIVLGTFMFVPQSFSQVAHLIYRDCFTTTENQIIYDACRSLFVKNITIDIVTVHKEIKESKKQINIPYLASLTSKSSGNYNIEQYCLILAQKHFSRQTILAADKAIKSALEDEDIFNIIDALISDINAFTGKLIPDMPKHIYKLLNDWDKKQLNEVNGLTGIDTGFKELNRLTGGWQNTDLITIAARPGMGKTSFVLHQAITAAKFGKKILFFSLEMSNEQLIQRMLSIESGISLTKIKNKNFNNHELPQYVKAYEKLAELPIYIDDKSKPNIFTLKSKMTKMKKDLGLDMVIIDFIQLIKGENPKNRNEELDIITQELKSLAKEFNIPILALSQLSRNVESRANKVPLLSDLRESGGIEQNSDIVMFIYRPEYYSIFQDEAGNSTIGKAYLLISKHRNGACKDINIAWDANSTRFYDNHNTNPISNEFF